MHDTDDFASALLEEARKLREAEEDARNEMARIAQEFAQLQQQADEVARQLEALRNKPLP